MGSAPEKVAYSAFGRAEMSRFDFRCTIANQNNINNDDSSKIVNAY